MINKEYLARELYTTYCRSVDPESKSMPSEDQLFSDRTFKNQAKGFLDMAERMIKIFEG